MNIELAMPGGQPEPMSLFANSRFRLRDGFEKNEIRPHWVVERLLRYADDNFQCNVTLHDVSKIYYIHEKYAGRLFRRQTGYTFHEYINCKRIERAKQFLVETDKTVLETALASGYQSVSYFNRIFVQTQNMTPTQYRKMKGVAGN